MHLKIKMANEPQRALTWAVTNADVEAMLDLLSLAVVDVDERDRACGLQTPLMRLCHMTIADAERRAVLRKLLERRPNVNLRDGAGRTALAHACIAQRSDVVEWLAGVAHCDPATRDQDGNTPLMHAVRARRPNLARTLLACFPGRLDVNARNNKGRTALNEAESREDIEICRLLITDVSAPGPPGPPFASVPPFPLVAPVEPDPDSSGPALQAPNPSTADPWPGATPSNTPRCRLDALPPVGLPHRPRGGFDPAPSPRSVRSSTGAGNLHHHQSALSTHPGESVSNRSSMLLLSLPEEAGGMPRKTALKKNRKNCAQEGSWLGVARPSRRELTDKKRKKKSHYLPNIADTQRIQHWKADDEDDDDDIEDDDDADNDDDKEQDGVAEGNDEDQDETPTTRDREGLSEKCCSPVSLPVLSEDLNRAPRQQDAAGQVPTKKEPMVQKPKNSSSLPNLAQTGAFLVASKRGHSNSTDNIAVNAATSSTAASSTAAVAVAAAAAAAAAALENRALDWERGVRSSYRKENSDFKLPQLNVALNGSLTRAEWGADPEARLDGSRLSSNGRNRAADGTRERILYSGPVSMRASRRFTSGD